MNHGLTITAVTFLLLICSLSASAQTIARIPQSWRDLVNTSEKQGSRQILLVLSRVPKQSRAELHCLEKLDGTWELALPSMAASVGRNGIADPGQKREGDGMSPCGIFPLGIAFGYEKECATKMPFRQMHADDIWVDDPKAADYNLLTTIKKSTASSYEFMRRKDDLYRRGLVVEYNTNPIIPGHGSAIFIHFWGRAFNSTSGCLGLPEKHLAAVLEFLDPAKKPVIIFSRCDLIKKD